MLGEKLIAAGIITQGQLDEALAEQKSSGKRLGETLVDKALKYRLKRNLCKHD